MAAAAGVLNRNTSLRLENHWAAALRAKLALRETVGGLVFAKHVYQRRGPGARSFIPGCRCGGSTRSNTNTLKKTAAHPGPGAGDAQPQMTDLIRFHHAERNFAAANEPKMFWGDPWRP